MDCEKLIIDLSIGDGYLSIPKSDKANSKLALKHSKKQVEYLLYKQKLLEDHGFKCTYYEYTDKNGYEIVTCTTRCSPIIKEIRTSLYINRVKTLSSKILEKFILNMPEMRIILIKMFPIIISNYTGKIWTNTLI